jgi:signal peptidase I
MPIIKEVGDPTAAFFASSVGGNEDQLPEFTIPYKGMQIVINKKTLRFYAKTIHDYEGNKKVVFNLSQGKLWIDDILTETYVFKKSYLFMLGRNLSLSDDSRYFGVIPLENVIGKALCVLINGKNPDVHLLYNLLTGNIDSSRFFRKL